ncbi:MAG: hypothetical protein SGJ19_28745 [Planctomycetia bacterium]|nr:hypothetical protein [Planctomycetia bacterium]
MKLRFEHVGQPLLPGFQFLKRLLISVGVGMGLIVLSLVAGMAGYHYLEDLSWIDAFLNASMILSGMGPLMQPETAAGKIFAGIYALYSGFAVLVIAGIALGPVVHRMLHRLHADDADLSEKT